MNDLMFVRIVIRILRDSMIGRDIWNSMTRRRSLNVPGPWRMDDLGDVIRNLPVKTLCHDTLNHNRYPPTTRKNSVDYF